MTRPITKQRGAVCQVRSPITPRTTPTATHPAADVPIPRKATALGNGLIGAGDSSGRWGSGSVIPPRRTLRRDQLDLHEGRLRSHAGWTDASHRREHFCHLDGAE